MSKSLFNEIQLTSASGKAPSVKRKRSTKKSVSVKFEAQEKEKYYPLSNSDIIYEKDMQGYHRLTARDRNGYLHKMAFSQMSKAQAIKSFKAHHKALYEGKSRP